MRAGSLNVPWAALGDRKRGLAETRLAKRPDAFAGREEEHRGGRLCRGAHEPSVVVARSGAAREDEQRRCRRCHPWGAFPRGPSSRLEQRSRCVASDVRVRDQLRPLRTARAVGRGGLSTALSLYSARVRSVQEDGPSSSDAYALAEQRTGATRAPSARASQSSRLTPADVSTACV